MIQYQILQTNIKGILWQKVRRITNENLEAKGLKVRSMKEHLNFNFSQALLRFDKVLGATTACTM